MNTVNLQREGVLPPITQAIRLLDSLSHPLTPSLFQYMHQHDTSSQEELLIQLCCDGDVLYELLEDFSAAGIVKPASSFSGSGWQFIPNRLQFILRQLKKL